MCDTIISTGQVTESGKAIFAKNSDRPPNESQHLVHTPAQSHAEGSELQCTYIRIPQVKETYATLLSQPYWMWGAEMGINEHGLAIGNEAIFAKTPPQKEKALLGMDLLRLALERAATPREAINVITALLGEFGQGGNGFAESEGKLYYHNSYLIANHEDAWVLESVNKEWVAHRIKEKYNISNCFSIQNEWELASPDIDEKNFNYTKKHADFVYTTFSKGQQRQTTIDSILTEKTGKLTLKDTLNILRHHTGDKPAEHIASVNVCMHAGYGPIRGSQSTASMVSVLDGSASLTFATGTAAPCTGIFKPLWIDTPLPQAGHPPANIYDAQSLFWSHEPLHRAVRQNYAERLAAYRADRDALEQEFIEGALALADAPAAERQAYATRCFEQAAEAEEKWLARVLKIPAKKDVNRTLNDLAWKGWSEKAKMPA